MAAPVMPPKHIRGPPVYKWSTGADGKRRGEQKHKKNALRVKTPYSDLESYHEVAQKKKR